MPDNAQAAVSGAGEPNLRVMFRPDLLEFLLMTYAFTHASVNCDGVYHQDPEEGPSVAISASEFAAYRLLHSCSISSRAYQAELLDQSKSRLLEHEFTRHALKVLYLHASSFKTLVSRTQCSFGPTVAAAMFSRPLRACLEQLAALDDAGVPCFLFRCIFKLRFVL